METQLYSKTKKVLKGNKICIMYDAKGKEIIYIYNNGAYIIDYNKIKDIIFKIDPNATSFIETEIIKKIPRFKSVVIFGRDEYNYLNFKNGLFNIKTDKLIEHTHKIFTKNKITHNLISNKKRDMQSKDIKIIDKFFSDITCQDKELEQLLFQIIGYCFYRDNPIHKFFILTGDGRNGKSTLLYLMEKIFNKRNRTTLKLKDLNDTFLLSDTLNKLVNLGDDISNSHIADSSTIKNLTSGDSFTFREIYKEPISVQPYTKFIFTANEIPSWSDKTFAFLQRIIIIPFNARFLKEQKDFNINIKKDLTTDLAIEYVISKSITALKVVLKSGFIEPQVVKKQHEQFEKDNNKVILFLQEKNIEEKITKNALYERYKTFCIEENVKALGKNKFGREIKRTKKFEESKGYIGDIQHRFWLKKDIIEIKIEEMDDFEELF